MQKHNNYDMCRKTRLSILVALVLLGSFLATDVEAAAVSGIDEVVREHSIEYVEVLQSTLHPPTASVTCPLANVVKVPRRLSYIAFCLSHFH